MRAFAIGTMLTLIIVLGALAHGQRTGAESPELAGSWTVSSQDGGQPYMLLMLNADGTAMTTDTDGMVHLGAWEATDDGHLAFKLVTLADRGGAQGKSIDFPVTEQADGSLIVGDMRLRRITPN